MSSSSNPPPSLLSLPPCILPSLFSLLPYPDALALRHTHPYFYYSPLLSTDRNVRLKVAWLVERKTRGLPVPTNSRTRFNTDAAFCASKEVKEIMVKRRRHGDCKGGEGGCEVVQGASCDGMGQKRQRWRSWNIRQTSWEALRNLASLENVCSLAVLMMVGLCCQFVWGLVWKELGGPMTTLLLHSHG
jgi:hypothetical protein